MNTIGIIQARMSSSRLPGKILLPLGGATALHWVYRRVSFAKLVDRVVIATTTNPADDIIEHTCRENDWPCFRGSEDDVLGRVYECAKANDADVIVDVTSDCPFVDPRHIDNLIQTQNNGKFDYVSNDVIDRSWPDGLDCQVYTMKTLMRAFSENHGVISEHSGWNIAKPLAHLFKIWHWKAPKELHAPDLSLSLDTCEDYLFLRKLTRSIVGIDFDIEILIRHLLENPGAVTNRNVDRKWKGAGQ